MLVKCIDDSPSPYWQDSQVTLRDTLSQHESKIEGAWPTPRPPAEITVFLLGPGSDPCPPQQIQESELVCVNWTFSSHWSPTYKHIIGWNWMNGWNTSRNICSAQTDLLSSTHNDVCSALNVRAGRQTTKCPTLSVNSSWTSAVWNDKDFYKDMFLFSKQGTEKSLHWKQYWPISADTQWTHLWSLNRL